MQKLNTLMKTTKRVTILVPEGLHRDIVFTLKQLNDQNPDDKISISEFFTLAGFQLMDSCFKFETKKEDNENGIKG